MPAEEPTAEVDVALLWRLRDVADAATEVAFEHQPPRLREALATLVSHGRSARYDDSVS